MRSNSPAYVHLRCKLIVVCLLLALCALGTAASAHGGVLIEEDVCIINIGFLQAHFTGYQPKSRGSKEFCEDIPDVAESVFVLDYLHDFLKDMPVDFRIIKDVQNFGIYAKWKDIQNLEDIDADTVFYQPPTKYANGVLTVDYVFDKAGAYIGIVTARHPTEDKVYNAVFPFEVGGSSYGYLPLFAALIVGLQLIYWLSTGKLTRMFGQSRE